MVDDMGTFRVTIQIENPLRRGVLESLEDALVDTGAELTVVPRARSASSTRARSRPPRLRERS